MAPTPKTIIHGGGTSQSGMDMNHNSPIRSNSTSLVVPSPPASGGVAFHPPTPSSASVSPGQPTALSPDALEKQKIDFIGSSAAVKDLFGLPYTSTDRVVSVAIHNVGGTLLFDQDDPKGVNPPLSSTRRKSGSYAHKRPLPRKTTSSLLEQQHSSDGSIVSPSFSGLANDDQALPSTQALIALSNSEDSLAKNNNALALVNSFLLGKGVPSPVSASSDATTIPSSERVATAPMTKTDTTTELTGRVSGASNEEENAELEPSRPGYEYVQQHIPSTPEPREYLSWKFHDHHLWVGSDALILRDGVSEEASGTASLSVRVEEAQDMQTLVQNHKQAVQSGLFRADHQLSHLQQQGKPSYATKVAQGKAQSQKNDQPRTEKEEEKRATSFSAPDLDQVKLQTCIVPSRSVPVGGLLNSNSVEEDNLDLSESGASNDVPSMDRNPTMVSPVSTVLDAYLDNIMANVPQLALCLREKGFIQSVKLMETESIPSTFLQPSTVDTSKPFEVVSQDESERVFSPQVMEMNATALLRFLKSNCNKDNSTYLLRREMGQANIHLYDISSISATKQRKWVWWLAMMSCRFAHRLKHISIVVQDRIRRRSFRNRERGLLMNALDLLELLSDMEDRSGSSSDATLSSSAHHESLIAGVRESLADTYLRVEEDGQYAQNSSALLSTNKADNDDTKHGVGSTVHPEPATLKASSQQPYVSVTVDALNKAHDYLSDAIKCLLPHFERMKSNRGKATSKKNRKGENRVNEVSTIGDSSSEDEDDEEKEGHVSEEGHDDRSLEVIATATQLFGLHEKIVNVSLRLAEIHLRNYYSSSAMQSLRSAARMIADSLYILGVLSDADKANRARCHEWLGRVQLQYVWLWEHCGHFARSFSSDELWRDRGHAAVDDILIVLQDAESAFTTHQQLSDSAQLLKESSLDFSLFLSASPLVARTNNSVNFYSLSGIVDTTFDKTTTKRMKQGDAKGVVKAREILAGQKFLQREQRKAIIAACLAYQCAIHAFEELDVSGQASKSKKDEIFIGLLQQRLGDACNEAGKILLNELRTQLSSRETNGVAGAAAHALLASAEIWFMEGLDAFEKSGDLKNLVLLRCNLCQCKKLRANALFDESKSEAHAEECLQAAATQLEAAHESLGERSTDSTLWDMVSAELAATFLVLGVRRRQSLIGSGNAPSLLQLRLNPGQERSIVEPMERALGIYGSSGNQHQAAAAHYQLALFFSKVWTCQRDETKTREKLGAAFRHYSAAHSYFTQAVDGNELTLCLVSLDLSNLYSSVQGEEGNAKALLCCMDTLQAIGTGAGKSKNQEADDTHSSRKPDDWYQQMDAVAATIEERVFKLLRSLVKLFDEGRTKIPYKDIYRAALTAKMMVPKQTSGVAGTKKIVERLSGVHSIIRATDDALSTIGLK